MHTHALKALPSSLCTLTLTDSGVTMLDQTQLPEREHYVTILSAQAMVEAIKTMVVRGAPAIGVAAAYGLVLSARAAQGAESYSAFLAQVTQDAQQLKSARPTAVNLAWAVDQVMSSIASAESAAIALEHMTQAALAITEAEASASLMMGAHGAALLTKGARLMTVCNAGALATVRYGTALAVIRTAYANDNGVRVYACETRPRLQGARLTAWELARDGVPVTVLADGMAASLMAQKQIDAVIVGADRIARNGDVANKIGTYSLAVLAHSHQIPFYVVAPSSTLDAATANGDQIVIEHRDASEFFMAEGDDLSAMGVTYYTPAFDVTPARLVTRIVTERGAFAPDAVLAQMR
ncbi:MAG: S-methyl-5-thioribose-1-phosphate isomerase [Vampirovibrionales bacterium]|nr:S-methyl-5-thioribose-1-phosphate isomerase [Vampirovibrionales bacterium]